MTEITHNPNTDGFDAWQAGYDDAMYDGIDTSSEMPCKCEACRKQYYEGQEAAIKEISGGKANWTAEEILKREG